MSVIWCFVHFQVVILWEVIGQHSVNCECLSLLISWRSAESIRLEELMGPQPTGFMVQRDQSGKSRSRPTPHFLCPYRASFPKWELTRFLSQPSPVTVLSRKEGRCSSHTLKEECKIPKKSESF